MMIATFTLYGLAFLTASFVIMPVTERANEAKHQQYLAGVGPVVYWAANMTADFAVCDRAIALCGCNSPVSARLGRVLWGRLMATAPSRRLQCYLVPAVLVVVVIACSGVPAYTEGGRMAIVVFLVLGNFFAVAPVMYLLSLCFRTPTTGFIIALMAVMMGASMDRAPSLMPVLFDKCLALYV
jgi:hypothetical protein